MGNNWPTDAFQKMFKSEGMMETWAKVEREAQAQKDAIWNEAINAAADHLGRGTTHGAEVLTLKRETKPFTGGLDNG